MIRKAYAFRPSLELMKEMRGLSPKEKLDWLEEATQLVAAFVSDEARDKWKRVVAASEQTGD